MNIKSFNFMTIFFVAVAVLSLIDMAHGIRCYKCKGDDECDFNTRVIHIENCTWATKCWGARIGGHFIRGCADDRCDIQIGVGSYIESKCCYTDMCNNQNFFFPNNSNKFNSSKSLCFTLFSLFMIFFYYVR